MIKPRKRPRKKPLEKKRPKIVFVATSLPQKCFAKDKNTRRESLWLLFHENTEVKQVRRFVKTFNKSDIKTRSILKKDLKNTALPTNIAFLIELLKIDGAELKKMIADFIASKGFAEKLMYNQSFLKLARRHSKRYRATTMVTPEILKQSSKYISRLKGFEVRKTPVHLLRHGSAMIEGTIYIMEKIPDKFLECYAFGVIGNVFSKALADAMTIAYAKKKGLLKKLLEWEKTNYTKRFGEHKSFIEYFAPQLKGMLPY